MNKNKENQIVKEISDNDLVEIIRKKDQEKYSEIVDRYQKKLFIYIYRLIGNKEEAEDLLQDVFVKAYKNLNSYDISRKFSSWIYRIAHNEAVNHIKRKSLKKFISWETIVSTKDKLDSSSEEEGADKVWLKKEASREVEKTINELPFKYKQVLTLRYYSERSYEEIAEILGKPVNTVGTLINRAKKKLAEKLKNSKVF